MFLEMLGSPILRGIRWVGKVTLFGYRALRHMNSGAALASRMMRAVFEMGVRCVPVICIVATFTGLVLGLQGHHVLSRFGATEMLGALVSLSLCRELAPVLAALMIAAQAGTALCAEIGIQRSTEQIDAIELMDVSAEGFLVGARLISSFFVFPVLTAVFVMVGVWGGWVSGCVIAPQNSESFWATVHASIHPHDVSECLLKALVFGAVTVTMTAFEGFHSHQFKNVAGARAVGLATVRGVVLSCIAILATDYLITAWMV